jgi:hypothetical protein
MLDNAEARAIPENAGLPMTLGEARVWALLVIFISYWLNIVRPSSADDAMTVGSVIEKILDNGAFDLVAWALVLFRLIRARAPRPAHPRTILSAFALGMIVLVPHRLAAAAAAGLFGASLLRDGEARVRKSGLVLCGLAATNLWTSPLFAPVHVLVGHFDAHVCAALLRLLGQDATATANVVENATTQFGIMVWPYCSSSFPLGDVALAFVVTLQILRAPWRNAFVPLLALSCVASVALTEMRLVLLAWDNAGYEWWHDGPGVSLYALAAVALAMAFPWIAARRAAGAPRTQAA